MSDAPTPRRVLFVDDEPKIVEGLQRRFRPHRAIWEVATATSAAGALALLDVAPFDVIVTDMRMPGMDGASLLELVRAKHPSTMRIVLSGQTAAAAAVRAVPVAHQFLNKPMDPSVLLESLNRVAATRGAIGDARVLAAVGRVDALPSPPGVCDTLIELIDREGASAPMVAALVERDPAVTLKLLQVVNSAFFGLRRQIYSVEEALSYLGTELVMKLVDTGSLLNPAPAAARRFDAEAFSLHAGAVAQMARLVGGDEHGEVCFVAGLLHDVGKLVMAAEMPALYDEIAQRAEASGRSFEQEEGACGATGHAKVGAYLVDLWGLPLPVVETLRPRLDDPPADASAAHAADAVRVAHRLLAPGRAAIGEAPGERETLSRMGLLTRLPALIARADEILGRA